MPTATSNALMVLPSYVTTDLALHYKANESTDLTLKVTNLLDERYSERAGLTADLQIEPGAPRTLSFVARKRF